MRDHAANFSWRPVAYRTGGWMFALGWLVVATLAPSQDYTFITLAGPSEPGPGSQDGPGNIARFNYPAVVATGSSANVYVADFGNNAIRQGVPAASDRALIDRAEAPVGVARQLGVASLTTIGWTWTFLRWPAASTAQLSSSTVWNPTFTLDVPDLYAFRLFATNATGQVVAISTVELLARVQLEVGQVPLDGSVALTLHSAAGQPCELLYSTNLTQWGTLTNLLNVTGADVFLDSPRPFPCRSYRLRQD